MSVKVPAVGTKEEVYRGLAMHTSGGLRKCALMVSPRTGKVVSKKKYGLGVKNAKYLGIKKSQMQKSKGLPRRGCTKSKSKSKAKAKAL